MDAESAKQRRATGLKAHRRKIEREVDDIFETFPEAEDSPADFRRIYESQFRKLDFLYVRTLASFKDRFGNVTAEDVGWGEFRTHDGLPSAKEIEDKVDKIQHEMDRWESHQQKKVRGRKIPGVAP